MPTRRVRAALILLLPISGAAQTTLGAGATGASHYVWRGITFTNASVLQPRLSLAHAGGAGTFSASAWGNVEPTTASSPNALRQGGSHVGLNEWDLTAQWGRSFAFGTLSSGWVGYRFNALSSVISDVYNTDEVWASYRADSLPFSPSLAAYRDVGIVGGWYLEGSVSRSVSAGSRAVSLTGVAGWSAGQEQADAGDAFYNFNQSGLTHVDLGAATSFNVLGLVITPSAHLQYSPSGQNTRVGGALPGNRDQWHKQWIAFDVGWSR